MASPPTAATKGVAKIEIVDGPLRTTEFIWSGSVGLLGLIGQEVLVMFLVFFLLASGDLFMCDRIGVESYARHRPESFLVQERAYQFEKPQSGG